MPSCPAVCRASTSASSTARRAWMAYGSRVFPTSVKVQTRPQVGNIRLAGDKPGHDDVDESESKAVQRTHHARHARTCAGHPCLESLNRNKTWMAGTSPAMTTGSAEF